MSDFREYELSGAAADEARRLGLTEKKVKEMAQQSAPFRDEVFTRRYKQYAFAIRKKVITQIAEIED